VSGGRFHIEAWQRSGVSRAVYCLQHRLDEKTCARWLKHLAGEDAVRKLTEYQAELRREKGREDRKKGCGGASDDALAWIMTCAIAACRRSGRSMWRR
jgi:hypothetical protein